MYKFLHLKWFKHIDFIVGDIIAIHIAYLISYSVKYRFDTPYSNNIYLRLSVLVFLLGICSAFFTQTYKNILKRNKIAELKSVLSYTFVVFLAIIIFMFIFQKSQIYSRTITLTLFPSMFILVFIERICIKELRKSSSNNDNLYKLMVFATQSTVSNVIKSLKYGPANQYNICGIVLFDSDEIGNTYDGIKVVANKNNIIDYIKNNVVDGIFFDTALFNPKDNELENIIDYCTKMGVSVHRGIFQNIENNNVITESFGKFTVITSSMKFASSGELMIKRAIDILAGVVGLVFIAIAFIFVAPLIYIKSPGPIFFTQTRVGKNGRKFKLYKFRSMYMDAEERKKELEKKNKIKDGLMFKMDDDPRIIKGIGQFIRKYSIDELPQLINVLKGDMSLVGTRPPTVDEVKQYDYHHKARLASRPGITGMWQISGRSNITDFETVVKLDTQYIQQWNLLLDFKILFKTFAVVLHKDGAS